MTKGEMKLLIEVQRRMTYNAGCNFGKAERVVDIVENEFSRKCYYENGKVTYFVRLYFSIN